MTEAGEENMAKEKATSSLQERFLVLRIYVYYSSLAPANDVQQFGKQCGKVDSANIIRGKAMAPWAFILGCLGTAPHLYFLAEQLQRHRCEALLPNLAIFLSKIPFCYSIRNHDLLRIDTKLHHSASKDEILHPFLSGAEHRPRYAQPPRLP